MIIAKTRYCVTMSFDAKQMLQELCTENRRSQSQTIEDAIFFYYKEWLKAGTMDGKPTIK